MILLLLVLLLLLLLTTTTTVIRGNLADERAQTLRGRSQVSAMH